MANPLDAFKGLKPWQQGAVAVGGIGVVGLVIWQHQKAKKTPAIPTGTPAAAAASGVASTAGEVEDPATGQYYPDGEVDPQSGLTYQQEIAEYGSVQGADDATSSVGNQAALQGITPQEYVEQTGGTGTTGGAPVTTNAQWMAEVESGLSEQNYSASDIGQGLAAYFASKPLGTSSDGTNLYTMMNLAIAEYGPPPTGSYPLLIASAPPPAGNGSSSSAPKTAPSHLTATTDASDLVASWSAVSGATQYGVELANGHTATVPRTDATFSVATSGPSGTVKVRAGNSAGWGPYSGPVSYKFAAAPKTVKPKTTKDGQPAAKQ